jgi:hypothetical protein
VDRLRLRYEAGPGCLLIVYPYALAVSSFLAWPLVAFGSDIARHVIGYHITQGAKVYNVCR